MDKNKNLILNLTLDFALEIIEFVTLLESQKKYVFAHQLLKSGTSIGANVHEAQNAESPVDFIHKLKIAAKEADETEYWLILCSKSNGFPDVSQLMPKLNYILALLNKIISTTKNRYKV